jgi:hypothetical protein
VANSEWGRAHRLFLSVIRHSPFRYSPLSNALTRRTLPMTQYAFGSGTLIGKRTDVANTPPALLGTLQDVSIDFDRKIELLLGQYNMPVAAGGGEFKIAGKAKFARLQATQINNLFLGQTLTSSGMLEMTTGESDTVASGAITVTNGSSFVEDYGVFNAATGAQLQPVTSSPAAGVSYVPGAAGVGQYSFASGDNGTTYLIYYSYTTGSGNKIALANQLMGPVPTFEISLKETFSYFGAQKDLLVKLNACISPKLSLPFSNQKFTVAEFDFQAIADAANNIGTISLSE